MNTTLVRPTLAALGRTVLGLGLAIGLASGPLAGTVVAVATAAVAWEVVATWEEADSAGAAVAEWVVATMGVEGMATGVTVSADLAWGTGLGYGYGYPGYGYGYPGYGSGYSGHGLGYSGYGYGSYPGYGSGSYYPDYGYGTGYVYPGSSYIVNSNGNSGYVVRRVPATPIRRPTVLCRSRPPIPRRPHSFPCPVSASMRKR